MNYEVSIVEATGFLTRKTFSEEEKYKLDELKKTAHDRAVKCLPFDQYEANMTHLVYYYEIKSNDDTIEVHIEMNPRLVDDITFYSFVETFKPEYVGAIHKH